MSAAAADRTRWVVPSPDPVPLPTDEARFFIVEDDGNTLRRFTRALPRELWLGVTTHEPKAPIHDQRVVVAVAVPHDADLRQIDRRLRPALAKLNDAIARLQTPRRSRWQRLRRWFR